MAFAPAGSISSPARARILGVHGVLIRDGRIDGGFDPRREGVVLTLPKQP